jgi:hypothetical protein
LVVVVVVVAAAAVGVLAVFLVLGGATRDTCSACRGGEGVGAGCCCCCWNCEPGEVGEGHRKSSESVNKRR